MADAVRTDLQVGSPPWWLNRLYRAIMMRQPVYDFYNAYYEGDHPLPWLAPQARDEFRRILAMSRTNYMGLVVDVKAQRLHVEGFRFGKDAGADDRSWEIWQASNFDSDSDMAWTESYISGSSFFSCEPNPQDASLPRLYVEHPSQCIVEYEPGTNRRVRRAALKLWTDDWTGKLGATLHLMVKGELYVFKFEANSPRSATPTPSIGTIAGSFQSEMPEWGPRLVPGETWGGRGNLDRIPIIEIPNEPRLLTGGRSLLHDITDIQDRVNKTVADRLITQDYGAFPQKWISAWPEEDAAGNPTPPIDIGRNRAVTTDVAEARFGSWETAPMDPYSLAKKEDVTDIAARKQLPAQYLLGNMSNVNGDTLKASQTGLIAAVRQDMRARGEAAEELMRCARLMAGLAGPGDVRMETIWSNPEFRTEGELTDAVVKKYQSGLTSRRQSREDLGYTATQIQQLEADDDKEGIDPLVRNALRDITGMSPEARGVAPADPTASTGGSPPPVGG